MPASSSSWISVWFNTYGKQQWSMLSLVIRHFSAWFSTRVSFGLNVKAVNAWNVNPNARSLSSHVRVECSPTWFYCAQHFYNVPSINPGRPLSATLKMYFIFVRKEVLLGEGEAVWATCFLAFHKKWGLVQFTMALFCVGDVASLL